MGDTAFRRAGLSKKLTWKKVAEDSGVSASTLTRMAQGKRPDVDSLAALLAWSGLHADDFVRVEGHRPSEADSLAKITAYLRADPNLSEEGASALEALLKSAYERLRRD
ncbi:helix-turn-helix domain-containing protein [Azospirillum himalayense]|uniref:Helix-turn-helix domain-containing protein n=1 Tax=Azospirillum himalayense TaxID=654847 RepID=A0ABW0G7Q2_9PROT